MEAKGRIFFAFVLNFGFSVFEMIGGILTGSVAIASDALHDLGDALSIGAAYLLEKKSNLPPDESYTYGYGRYSQLGALLTTTVLILGSLAVIFGAVRRIIIPAPINYSGMIVFAIIGTAVNLLAAIITKDGGSANQKAVSLHMLEDVLGWIVVLIGAVVMKFTDLWIIDPLLSIGVSLFILFNAIASLREILELFLEKTPHSISVSEIKEHLLNIDSVEDVHHIHVWTVDGKTGFATMHIVSAEDSASVKLKARAELLEHGISHATLEIERPGEKCDAAVCEIKCDNVSHSHHHHHHGHHHHHH